MIPKILAAAIGSRPVKKTTAAKTLLFFLILHFQLLPSVRYHLLQTHWRNRRKIRMNKSTTLDGISPAINRFPATYI